jgi:hypothetical protein
MKDMFYKYDNLVDDDKYLPIFKQDENDLEYNGSTTIVKDVFNREIGIMVRHNHEFTLYFYLFDLAYMSNEQFFELIENSNLIFEIYSGRHVLMLQKEFSAKEALNETGEAFCIKIEQQEAAKLDIDTYKMKLILS